MPRNLDYPMPMHGRMMRQRLWEAQIDAGMLYDTLRDDDAVPAWTLDKVARGADGIHQVSRYLRFKASNPAQWGAVPEEKPGIGQLVLGIATLWGAGFGLYALLGVAMRASGALDPKPVAAKKRKRARRHFGSPFVVR